MLNSDDEGMDPGLSSLSLEQCHGLIGATDTDAFFGAVKSNLNRYADITGFWAWSRRSASMHWDLLVGRPPESNVPVPSDAWFSSVVDSQNVTPVPAMPVPGTDEKDPRFLLIPISVRGVCLAVVVIQVATEIDHYVRDLMPLNSVMNSQYERLHYWQSLLDISDLMDNVIESIPQCVVVVSSDNKVLAINSNAEFMFDIRRLMVLEQDYHDVFVGEVGEQFSQLQKNLVEGGLVEDVEVAHCLKGKTCLRIEISPSLVRDRAGLPIGVMFICRDLSLNQEVAELRELDQLKTEFLNTVSHELKTPLTAISGAADILKLTSEGMDEDSLEILDVLVDGTARLQTLIHDLLDFSRLQANTVPLNEAMYSIEELVQDAMVVQSPKQSHSIQMVFEPDLPDVLVDGQKILQVLTNFISNAIKYSPEGGEIRIEGYLDGQNMRVDVSDQGLGLSEANLEHVWDKFYRVEKAETSEIEGTGLGLAIVRRIVELHGGETKVASVLGEGSTFSVLLPVQAHD